MILSCDPPRHAFLIHFGKRLQPHSIQILESKYCNARVQIAINAQSVPPSLVAIHFVRHGFRLPFVCLTDDSTDCFNLLSGLRRNQYFFHFDCNLRSCKKWQAYPGLTVLVSRIPKSGSGSARRVQDRPVLFGLLVDAKVLGVDIDMGEFVFEFGPDSLKDVSVSRYIEEE